MCAFYDFLRGFVKSESSLDSLFIKTWNNSCSIYVEEETCEAGGHALADVLEFHLPLNAGAKDGVGEKFLFSAY